MQKLDILMPYLCCLSTYFILVYIKIQGDTTFLFTSLFIICFALSVLNKTRRKIYPNHYCCIHIIYDMALIHIHEMPSRPSGAAGPLLLLHGPQDGGPPSRGPRPTIAYRRIAGILFHAIPYQTILYPIITYHTLPFQTIPYHTIP